MMVHIIAGTKHLVIIQFLEMSKEAQSSIYKMLPMSYTSLLKGVLCFVISLLSRDASNK